MKTLAALLLTCALIAQNPSRRFKDGEALRVGGATVTIRDPRSAGGQCVSAGPNNVLKQSTAACADPGPGFFQVHLANAPVEDRAHACIDMKGLTNCPPLVDYIEIQIGVETSVTLSVNPARMQTMLRFRTFTSSIQRGIDTSVGEIDDLTQVRTIRVRLFRTQAEGMFR